MQLSLSFDIQDALLSHFTGTQRCVKQRTVKSTARSLHAPIYRWKTDPIRQALVYISVPMRCAW